MSMDSLVCNRKILMVGRGFSVKFKNKAKTSTTAALSCTTKDSFSKITKEEKKTRDTWIRKVETTSSWFTANGLVGMESPW